MTEKIAKLAEEYEQLLQKQEFDKSSLDYSILSARIPFLEQLSQVENSAITVFDMCVREHVFASYNMTGLLGYDMNEIKEQGTEYFNSRIHPEDMFAIMQNAIYLLEYYYKAPKDERKNYKLVNEYRVLDPRGEYIRVIEQHQVLEFDNNSNPWLTISTMDISPSQENSGIRSQVVNFKTGELVPYRPKEPFDPRLTERETEILQLVKSGLLSKEISDRLSISIHTVNTHRQRILSKLNANNSVEALNHASVLGLV